MKNDTTTPAAPRYATRQSYAEPGMTANVVVPAAQAALLAVAWWHEHTYLPLEDGVYFMQDGKVMARCDSRGVTIYGGML